MTGRTNSTTKPTVAALLILAAGAVWYLTHFTRARSALAFDVASRDTHTLRDERLPAPVDTQLVSVREYLQAYWGTKWSTVESNLDDRARQSLDQIVDALRIPPWEFVKPMAREELRSTLLADRVGYTQRHCQRMADIDTCHELKSAHITLSQNERADLQLLAARRIDSIERLSAHEFDLLMEVDESIWDGDRYNASPLVRATPDSAVSALSQGSIVRVPEFSPWVVSYTIDFADWPQLATAHAALIGEYRSRDAEIADYLRTLGSSVERR